MEVTIKIDSRSAQAKAFLAYLKALPFVKIKERYNSETEKVIKEVREGKGIIRTTSHADLMKKLRS